MTLRPYQNLAITMTWDWLRTHKGNMVLCLPTGAGKSVIIAELCRQAIQGWPGTRILMLSHVAELLQQDLDKMLHIWPNAPVATYSASMKSRSIDAITFAGIQSIRGKSDLIGHVDLVLIDECHLVNNNEEGAYRTLLNELTEINPFLRVIGLTATPFRMGQGSLVSESSLFNDIVTPVTVIDLINHGYLSRLDSKHTNAQLSVEGVHKRGGDYIESELQKAVDTTDNNSAIVKEIIEKAGDRKSWLVFCAGVQHAYHIAQLLNDHGIVTESITGETELDNRADSISGFKNGSIRCLTSVGVLTTGFDHPGIDLIAFLRPTCSKSLYHQQAGRGLRLKPHTDHCLILDFAGLVAQHGPITALDVDKERQAKDGEPGAPPCKVCPECGEIVFISVMVCKCGHEWVREEKPLTLHNDDIMGDGSTEFTVTGWKWTVEKSKSGKDMIVITYYSGPLDTPVKEYLCVWHDGWAGQKARSMLNYFAKMCSVEDATDTDNFQNAIYPTYIKYVKDGQYKRITERNFEAPF